jgi:predicted dehydrogenase
MRSTIWLIGAGAMAREYAFVLKALKQPFEVVGRSVSSASSFKKATGCNVKISGLQSALKKAAAPVAAIVAVGVEQLAEATKDLIYSGTKYILLEKPGALNLEEIYSLNLLANKKKAKVFVAYNRRFYQSVQQTKDLIKKDGGALSMNFEFTEWEHAIKPLKSAVKERLVIANSSHVIDLAFYLCGKPKKWKCWHAGSLDWHPASARFCGSGITDQGIMFSYLSDWQAQGRWSLEIMTNKRRLILRPMEQLQEIKKGSILVKNINSENTIDTDFKAGLFLQTKKFLKREDSYLFCSLPEQVENIKIYYKIAGYSHKKIV